MQVLNKTLNKIIYAIEKMSGEQRTALMKYNAEEENEENEDSEESEEEEEEEQKTKRGTKRSSARLQAGAKKAKK